MGIHKLKHLCTQDMGSRRMFCRRFSRFYLYRVYISHSINIYLIMKIQSSQPFHFPLPPLKIRASPHSRNPYQPRRYKSNPGRVPFPSPLHQPPRNYFSLRRWWQRRLFRSCVSWAWYLDSYQGRLGNYEIDWIRNVENSFCS